MTPGRVPVAAAVVPQLITVPRGLPGAGARPGPQ